MIPARSLVVEAQVRAKSLRLADSRVVSKQDASQIAEEKLGRKLELISIFMKCSKLTRDDERPDGMSMREFVEEIGHEWSTGYGYLSEEKRFPKPRTIRKALALLEDIESGRFSDRERVAKGLKVA